MSTIDRLRQLQTAGPRNTVAVSSQVLDLLRRSSGAHEQNQVRQVETARKQEESKKHEWNRGR
jgi:hypothetical protein